jgi:hypothetical protein
MATRRAWLFHRWRLGWRGSLWDTYGVMVCGVCVVVSVWR